MKVSRKRATPISYPVPTPEIEVRPLPDAASGLLVDPATGKPSFAYTSRVTQAKVGTSIGAPKGSSAPADSLEQSRSSMKQFYEDAKANAVNERNGLKYVGAHIAGLLGEVGYDTAESARGLYRLATDSATQQRAIQTVGYLAQNPGVVVDATVDGVKNFMNKPFNEQADAVFKGGVGLLVGGGGSKAASIGGDLAYQGTKKAIDVLGPTADTMLHNYLSRTGGILNMVPEGPNFGANSAKGVANVVN